MRRAPVFLVLFLFTVARGFTAEAPAVLQHALARAQAGDVFLIDPLNPVNLPSLAITRAWTGGTLIFSDSPEYVPGPGVLYADSVPPGFVRIMLYHVNDSANSGTSTRLKFTVVVEPANAGETTTVTLLRSIVKGPSSDYGKIGRTSAYDFLTVPESPVVSQISAPTVLDPVLESKSVPARTYPQLIQAQYDLQVSGASARFTLAALASNANTLATYKSLPMLAREESAPGVYVHDRGTFPGHSDKRITNNAVYDTIQGATRIRMAGGTWDPWVTGTVNKDPFAGEGSAPDQYVGYDAILGVGSRVLGNYGVMYTVRLNTSSSDGRRLAILLNPRGGAHAGAVNATPGLTGAGPAYVPPLNVAPLATPSHAGVLGRWDPTVTPVIELKWTPTGAFSLPVEWVLVPYPEPGDVDGNGRVELPDAVLAARILNGQHTPTSRQSVAADVDPESSPDGYVTAVDVSWILRTAGGLR